VSMHTRLGNQHFRIQRHGREENGKENTGSRGDGSS
jgi:hypothetical protein